MRNARAAINRHCASMQPTSRKSFLGGSWIQREPRFTRASVLTRERNDNMGFFGFLLLGLLAGAIAKLILPGKQGGGWLVTLLLGVVGALLGGFLGSVLFNAPLQDFFSLQTWLLA